MLFSVLISLLFALPQQTPQPPAKTPDVIWLATEDKVADAMLKLAKISKTDVVYDLGCGDGKIVIAAAKKFGARGVGIDINPDLVKVANENAAKAGVADKTTFIVGDIFDPKVTFSDASIVTLYLLPELNRRLMPRLKTELKPGTRIVSNSFEMGDAWPPEKVEHVGNFYVYLWTIAPR
jgi:cyclopropane fatty-acyl-phospholipid synthase-like methyltransferase